MTKRAQYIPDTAKTFGTTQAKIQCNRGISQEDKGEWHNQARLIWFVKDSNNEGPLPELNWLLAEIPESYFSLFFNSPIGVVFYNFGASNCLKQLLGWQRQGNVLSLSWNTNLIIYSRWFGFPKHSVISITETHIILPHAIIWPNFNQIECDVDKCSRCSYYWTPINLASSFMMNFDLPIIHISNGFAKLPMALLV